MKHWSFYTSIKIVKCQKELNAVKNALLLYIYTTYHWRLTFNHNRKWLKTEDENENERKRERNEVHTFKAQLHHGISCTVYLVL